MCLAKYRDGMRFSAENILVQRKHCVRRKEQEQILQSFCYKERRHVITSLGWLVHVVETRKAKPSLGSIEGCQHALAPVPIDLFFGGPPQEKQTLNRLRPKDVVHRPLVVYQPILREPCDFRRQIRDGAPIHVNAGLREPVGQLQVHLTLLLTVEDFECNCSRQKANQMIHLGHCVVRSDFLQKQPWGWRILPKLMPAAQCTTTTPGYLLRAPVRPAGTRSAIYLMPFGEQPWKLRPE
mmetsp:Transcript_5096/g.10756  ORF Transcript_5096/g.10756 Transcript_5096/m.10756 type:complete len:238 (-) Transcript_5096:453-1166(-)